MDRSDPQLQCRLLRRNRRTAGFLLAGLLLGSTAHAQSPGAPPRSERSPAARTTGTAAKPEPSAEQLAAAKGFFENGRELFKRGKYDAAWIEFSSAYEMVDLPDLLYNMARSEEKLNRRADAARHYREFLARSPDDPDADKVRATIAELEGKPVPVPEPVVASLPAPDPAPPRRFPVYSAIAGGGTVLLAIIGAATLGAGLAKYNDLAATCAPRCTMADALSPQPTYQTGQAFLTLAAIGAAGTAGLLVWELRQRRGERKAAMLLSPLTSPMYGSH